MALSNNDERRLLLEWPYTLYSVSKTLDPELIEARGKLQLFRALADKNLVAFVGSGLSVAYGRLGWAEWQHNQLEITRRMSRAFVKTCRASLEFLEAQSELVSQLKSGLEAPENIQEIKKHAEVLLNAADEDFLGVLEKQFRFNKTNYLLRDLSLEFANAASSEEEFSAIESFFYRKKRVEKLPQHLSLFIQQLAEHLKISGRRKTITKTRDRLVDDLYHENEMVNELADSHFTYVSKLEKDSSRYRLKFDNHSLKELRYVSQISSLLETKIFEITKSKNDVQELENILSSLTKDGKFPGGESMPVVFQCADQLLQLVQSVLKIFVSDRRESEIDEPNYSFHLKNACLGFLTHREPTSSLSKGLVSSLEDLLFLSIDDNSHELLIDIEDNDLDWYVGEVYRRELDRISEAEKHYRERLKRLLEFALDSRASLPMQDMAKRLLVDEVAYCDDLVKSATRYDAYSGRRDPSMIPIGASEQEIKNTNEWITYYAKFEKSFSGSEIDNLNRDIKGIREEPDRYSSLGYFTTYAFEGIIDVLGSDLYIEKLGISSQWSSVFLKIKNELERNMEGATEPPCKLPRNYVSPGHRYVFKMLMHLVEDPMSTFAGWVDLNKEASEMLPSLENCVIPAQSRRNIRSLVTPHTFRSRYSLVDPECDPLEKIVSRMGVNRFLTTNYDFEIERYFQDIGYRQFVPDPEMLGANAVTNAMNEGYRTDTRGSILRDYDFTRQTATDLVEFSIDHVTSDASVFHLHGRADKDSRLVISEEDYMDQYVRRDEFRETVDECIEVAFSANPLLFLGLGMNEADVLRPLRQFISDKGAAAGRSAFVLMAANKNKDARNQYAVTLFLRYGVHVIHYGDASIGLPDASGEYIQLDWLHRVFEFVTQLEETNLRIADGLSGWISYFEELRDKNEEIEPVVEGLRKSVNEINKTQKDRLTEINNGLGHLKYKNDHKVSVLEILLGFEFGCLTGGIDMSEFQSYISSKQPDELSIADCIFTEDYNSTAVSPNGIKASETISFEQTLLMEMFLQTLNIQERDISKRDWKDFESLPDIQIKRKRQFAYVVAARKLIRESRARLVALAGIKSSLMTGVLCIAVENLAREAQFRQLQWRISPPHRVPRFSEVKGSSPKIYVRHRVDPENTSKINNNSQGSTGIRAFNHFVQAVDAQRKLDLEDENFKQDEELAIRSFFLVLSPKGHGKGAFFSAFSSQEGYADYRNARTGNNAINYVSGVFINLSFSTEVASTFDMLIKAVAKSIEELVKPCTAHERGECFEVHEKYILSSVKSFLDKQPTMSRVRQLEEVLKRFKHCNDYLRKNDYQSNRLTICISGIELLYDREGRPKNREIELIMDALCGDSSSQVPIDVVFVCTEDRVGERLRPVTRFQENFYSALSIDSSSQINVSTIPKSPIYNCITRPGISSKGIELIFRRLEVSGLNHYPIQVKDIGNDQTQIDKKHSLVPNSIGDRDLPDSRNFVYFTRVMEPTSLLVDTFKTLAWFLYFKEFMDSLPKLNEGTAKLINWEDLENVLGDGYLDIENFRYGVVSERKKPGDSYRKCRQLLASNRDLKIYEVLSRLKRAIEDANETQIIFKPADETSNSCAWLDGYKDFLTEPDKHVAVSKLFLSRYDAAREIRNQTYWEWRDIRLALRGNRYCMTLLLGAAQHYALTFKNIYDAGIGAERFIRDAVQSVRSTPAEERESVLLSRVLKLYRSFHVIGRPTDDYELHMLIVRHLGVIGIPMSVDVLVRAPQIRAYLDKISNDEDLGRRRSDILDETLTEMCARGLVLRVDPTPRLKETYEKDLTDYERLHIFGHERIKDDDALNQHYRYGLHRLMHRHVVDKMGAGRLEFVEINNFAPSLFASMPAELPRLTFEAYGFLSELVSSLSQYPDNKIGIYDGESWHIGLAPLSTKVQALRAAMSTVRSVFSIAVVSRFEEYQGVRSSRRVDDRGYFEEYRIQLRWIIRKAAELLHDSEEPFDRDPASTDRPHIAALYRDEIVWLHNECGVVSLVQGNVTEALSILQQSIEMNRAIEGEGRGGPQFNRLAINLSLAYLESGRLNDAEYLLTEVMHNEERFSGNRKGRVWHIAAGYHALNKQLQGRQDQAEKIYAEVLNILRIYEDSRACAVFLRHRADLARASGRYDLSREYLNEAIGFAERGGHEDLNHAVRLAVIKLDLAESENVSQNVSNILRRLKTIERYAKIMEMPALLCESYSVKAGLLLRQGDTSLAGELFSKAMVLATRNGMMLRLNYAMVGYAKVLNSRGLAMQAQELLFTAREMAKRFGAQLAIRRVEAALDEIDESTVIDGLE